MTVRELIDRYQRRQIEATRLKATGSLAEAYLLFLEDLRGLDGKANAGGYVGTEEAGKILTLDPRTVARKAARGDFPGACKTSGQRGEWRIPLSSLEDEPMAQHPARNGVSRLLGDRNG